MKNEPAFINRRRELAFLNSWIAERPNNLLFETFAKRHLFVPSVVRKCSFTIEYAAFAAELKNKNLRFLHAVSSYAKLSFYPWPKIERKDHSIDGIYPSSAERG